MLGNQSHKVVSALHRIAIRDRRTQTLSRHLASFLPKNRPIKVLDVGSGEGGIACALALELSNIIVEGVDTSPRSRSLIKTTLYDGVTLPFPDVTFDVTLLVDVLHHASQPNQLLAEAMRVTRNQVLVKDHFASNLLDTWILRSMDWAGNPRSLRGTTRYFSQESWKSTLEKLGITETLQSNCLDLYPKSLKWVCERDLHFLSVLERNHD